MDDYKYDIGRLKRAALERGWTRTRIAKETGKDGVSQPTVCRVWRGESVTETTVRKIADALGVPMSEIVIPVEREVTA